MSSDLRKPKQKRSIEKKNKIIEAGFKLFSEKGYHNTNTAEIAKEAGVSTGIVYNYFKDKKDIFMATLELYLNQMYKPIYDWIKLVQKPIDLPMTIRSIIFILIQSHKLGKSSHEEMQAMSHLDDDINKYFHDLNDKFINFWIDFLEKNDIKPTNVYEKMHIVLNLIEDISHEYVYHKQDDVDYDIMIDEIVNIIVNLLSK